MWRLTSRLNERDAKALGDAFLEQADLGADAVSLFEGETGWRLDVIFLSEPSQDRLASFVEGVVGRHLVVMLEPVQPADWVAMSLEGLTAVRVGRFLVHGSHDRGCQTAGALDLEVNASLAFGTGHHATTQGCLEALNDLAKRARPLRILDVGTGTGILAMAAAKLFRRPVLASDIDPVSVRLARDNAKLNGVAQLIEVIEAEDLESARFRDKGPFDLVLANILAGSLARLAAPMRPLLAPQARIILSGLLPAQEGRVLSAFRLAAGLSLEQRLKRQGWSTLVLAALPRRRPKR
jgi:ribosomal protein L11 methyltransferase